MADNQDVQFTGSSGEPGFFDKLCGSILCAMCGAPLMLLGATFLLGSNEKIAVCQSRAISAGESAVKEVGCTKSKDPLGNDALVMFSCPLKKTGLALGKHWLNYDTAAGIMPLDYTGTGLDIKVEMLQCVESSTTDKHDDRTVTTYHYRPEWEQQPVDSFTFAKVGSTEFKTNCGRHNPSWPLHMPRSTTLYAPTAKIGEFELSENFVQKVPLSKPVDLAHFATGWDRVSSGVYETNQYVTGGHVGSQHVIGSMRVTLSGTNWDAPTFTALGHETSGIVKTWAAPPAWLCSGYKLDALKPGRMDKPSMFESLQDEADTLLYFLRIVGFCIMWCAFAALAAPCGIVADAVPFVGECLGNAVDSITCCISCVPATACCFMVAGVVWVVMRPEVGIPLLLGCLVLWGGLAYLKMQRQAKAGGGGGPETEALNNAE